MWTKLNAVFASLCDYTHHIQQMRLLRSRFSEFMDLVFEHLQSRNPIFKSCVKWPELKKELLKNFNPEFWAGLSEQEKQSIISFFTSKFPDAQVGLRYLFVHLFENITLKSDNIPRHAIPIFIVCIKQLFTSPNEFITLCLNTLSDNADLSFETLVAKIICLEHKLEYENKQSMHAVQILQSWQRNVLNHIKKNLKSPSEQAKYFNDYDLIDSAALTESSLVKGQGIYKNLYGEELYLKSTSFRSNVADNLCVVLVSDLRNCFTSDRFVNYFPVKSNNNEVFVASKLLKPFSPLMDNTQYLTTRVDHVKQEEIFSKLTSKERYQLQTIIVDNLFFKDYDCNPTNIGRTTDGLKRIDHQWVFQNFANLEPINISEDIWPLQKNLRLGPTNCFLDFLPLIIDSQFVQCVDEFLEKYNTESLREQCAKSLINLLEYFDKTVPASHLLSNNENNNCYTRQELLNAIITRMGSCFEDESTEETALPELVETLMKGFEHQRQSLFILARTIELKLILDTSTEETKALALKMFYKKTKSYFDADESLIPKFTWEVLKAADNNHRVQDGDKKPLHELTQIYQQYVEQMKSKEPLKIIDSLKSSLSEQQRKLELRYAR